MNKTTDKPNVPQRETVSNVLQLFSGFLFWFLSLTAVPVFADTLQMVDPQQTHNQIMQTLASQQYSLKDRAKMWGLSTEDYKHYLNLMQNTPSGHWYKQLDPAEVLALNAKDPDQMMVYAKIQARNMHARVTRELAFDKIYSEAYKQLYPNEKPIMSPDQAAQGAALQSGDRVWLFVGVNTPLGSFAYQHLMKAVKTTPNTVLDIYFVGKNITQKSIQQWAMSLNIPRNIVNKQVTLNYGDDRFESLTKGKKVSLPFVGVVHDSHFQPITLSSVL